MLKCGYLAYSHLEVGTFPWKAAIGEPRNSCSLQAVMFVSTALGPALRGHNVSALELEACSGLVDLGTRVWHRLTGRLRHMRHGAGSVSPSAVLPGPPLLSVLQQAAGPALLSPVDPGTWVMLDKIKPSSVRHSGVK